MSDARKNIVIVGGGFAGNATARALSKQLDGTKYNIVLINERLFTIHTIATIRMTVSATENLEETSLIPYDKLFIKGNGTFKLGKVVGVTDNSVAGKGFVTLEGGEEVPYHVLVIASGSYVLYFDLDFRY